MKHEKKYRGYYHPSTRPFVSYGNNIDHYPPPFCNNAFHHSYYSNNFRIYNHGYQDNIQQLRSTHNQNEEMRQAWPTNSFHNSMHLMQPGIHGSPIRHYVNNFQSFNESQHFGQPSSYSRFQPPPFPSVRDVRNPSYHHHRQHAPREPLPSLVLPDLNHDVNQISPTISPTTETRILSNRATYKGRFSPGKTRIKLQVPTSPTTKLRENDIVCGRGAPTLFHEGNKKFRDLILQYQSTYLFSKRPDKPRVAWNLLEIVALNGGRFVRRVKVNNTSTSKESSCHCWEPLNERQAYDKICQSLREGAPELRRRILCSHDSKRNSKTKALHKKGKEKTQHTE